MNNDTQKKRLAVVMLLIGTAIYVAALVWTGVASLKHVSTGDTTPAVLPGFIDQVVVVIGGALATYFGAWMGITFDSGRRPLSIRGIPTLEKMGTVLAWLYPISLVLALIFWAVTGFSQYAAGSLQNLSYTILGVFAGIVAVWLKEA